MISRKTYDLTPPTSQDERLKRDAEAQRRQSRRKAATLSELAQHRRENAHLEEVITLRAKTNTFTTDNIEITAEELAMIISVLRIGRTL